MTDGRYGKRHVLAVVMMMTTMLGGDVGLDRPTTDLHIGPDPHVYTEEEGRRIAAQIAARRKARRRGQ